MTIKTYREAVKEALAQEMERDECVVLTGEDLRGGHGGNAPEEAKTGAFGGILGVTKGLWTQFGSDRVIDTPTTESAIIGMAVGATATGLRPVVELMFMDFFGMSHDALYDQAAKFRYMFGGKARAPLVMRGTIGTGFFAATQHSQPPYNIFTTTPGLKVVVPSTPYDVKGSLIQSIRSNDPVVFCEYKMLYDLKDEVPDEIYTTPLGVVNHTREGEDVIIIALPAVVHKANQMADKLAREGISAEVVDPQTIPPPDEEGILESVASTGRVVIVDESTVRFGFAHNVAALIASQAFHFLKAPVLLVTPSHTPVPLSPALEKLWIPSAERIEAVVRQVLEDQPTSEVKTLEMPKWGLPMEEGLPARWAIQEGDNFTRGQEICETETSKIVNVLGAPPTGTLRRTIAREGETLQVGAVLALVADASVSNAKLSEFVAGLATVKPIAPDPEAIAPDVVAQADAKPPSVVPPPPNSPEPPTGQTVIPVSLQSVTDMTQVNATPHALRLSVRWGVDPKKVRGSGCGECTSVSDLESAIVAAGSHLAFPTPPVCPSKALRSHTDDSQVLTIPLARRLAGKLGINLHDCRGSGSRGRMSRDDVLAAALLLDGYPPVSPVQESVPTPFESILMFGMRRVIASRLQTFK